MTLKEGFYVAWNTKQRRVGDANKRRVGDANKTVISVLYVFLTYEEFSVITFHYAMLCNQQLKVYSVFYVIQVWLN